MERELTNANVLISQPFYPAYLTRERIASAPELKVRHVHVVTFTGGRELKDTVDQSIQQSFHFGHLSAARIQHIGDSCVQCVVRAIRNSCGTWCEKRRHGASVRHGRGVLSVVGVFNPLLEAETVKCNLHKYTHVKKHGSRTAKVCMLEHPLCPPLFVLPELFCFGCSAASNNGRNWFRSRRHLCGDEARRRCCRSYVFQQHQRGRYYSCRVFCAAKKARTTRITITVLLFWRV